MSLPWYPELLSFVDGTVYQDNQTKFFCRVNNEAVVHAVLWRSGSAPLSLTLEAQFVRNLFKVLTSDPRKGQRSRF
ncbi:uncharacterized [Tachysurus ichikawai]